MSPRIRDWPPFVRADPPTNGQPGWIVGQRTAGALGARCSAAVTGGRMLGLNSFGWAIRDLAHRVYQDNGNDCHEYWWRWGREGGGGQVSWQRVRISNGEWHWWWHHGSWRVRDTGDVWSWYGHGWHAPTTQMSGSWPKRTQSPDIAPKHVWHTSDIHLVHWWDMMRLVPISLRLLAKPAVPLQWWPDGMEPWNGAETDGDLKMTQKRIVCHFVVNVMRH